MPDTPAPDPAERQDGTERATALFYGLFEGLPRQGPGTAASTRKALALVPDVGPRTRILDVGCGTGAQTLVLAGSAPSRIVAIDNHPPFIEALNRKARDIGVADRVSARVADMRRLDFGPHVEDGAFDLIWCEGAIYNVGVEAGLRDWRRLLRHNGHVALTEVCWRRPDPPAACAAFWEREYPAIRDTAALLEAIDACGYETVGHFPLPAAAWWDDYYRPLQDSLNDLRKRHPDVPEARALADALQAEIDVWQAHGRCYGYEFVVLRIR